MFQAVAHATRGMQSQWLHPRPTPSLPVDAQHLLVPAKAGGVAVPVGCSCSAGDAGSVTAITNSEFHSSSCSATGCLLVSLMSLLELPALRAILGLCRQQQQAHPALLLLDMTAFRHRRKQRPLLNEPRQFSVGMGSGLAKAEAVSCPWQYSLRGCELPVAVLIDRLGVARGSAH